MKAVVTVVIFVLVYALIATEKVSKTVVAILGASLLILLRLITFERAIESVDFNVIFLLVGMMTTVSILAHTGFFEWAATALAKRARGNPVLIMILLLASTAAFSAVLDNVTTVILLVPVTILIAQILEISPLPLVIMEAIASNIGGTSTLIGDPPNIIIGSQANLSFNAFLANLGPAIILVFICFVLTAWVVFRSRLNVPVHVRRRLSDAIPALAIVDKPGMIKALVVIAFMLAGFFMHKWIGLEPGVVALTGSMVLMLICRTKDDEALMRVEWGVIFFFIGLFMIIAALEENGVLQRLAQLMLDAAGDRLFLLCVIVLWGSAFLSSILDNIPFVLTMVPMLKLVIPAMAQTMHVVDPVVIQAQIAQPIWWSLALGACLGGNGSLVGASANVVMAQICRRNKYKVTFWLFTQYGFAFMIQSVVVSTLYIWLRYFAL